MERNFDKNNENCAEFLSGQHTVCCTFTDRKFINRMKKLYANADFNGKFDYFKENSDGSICCRIPKKWLKINPGSANKREISEEQLQAAVERLKLAREKRFE